MPIQNGTAVLTIQQMSPISEAQMPRMFRASAGAKAIATARYGHARTARKKTAIAPWFGAVVKPGPAILRAAHA